MPIKRIQFPDGSIKRVEVPEGATDQQILDFVQSSYKPQKPKADFSQVAANSGSSGVPKSLGKSRTYADRMSTFDRFGSGVVAPIADTVVGLSEITGIGSKKWQDEVKARIDSVRGTTAGKVGSFAGEVGMLAIPATKIAQAPSFAARLAGNVALGGASGGLRGLREGETRGGNMLLGAAAGGAGGVAGEALGVGVRGLRGVIDPLTKRGQQRIASMTIRNSATNPQNLGRVAPSAIPGVQRTLAEETLDPGVAQLQRQFSQQLSDLGVANNEARVGAVRRAFHGATEDAALGIEAVRDEAANRTLAGLGAVRNAPAVADPPNFFGSLGGTPARAAQPPEVISAQGIDGMIGRMVREQDGRPAVQSALSYVRDLTRGGFRDAEHAYRVRKTIGDLMDGKLGGDQAAATTARRELLQVRDALDNEMSRAFPEWGQYLKTYRADSTRAEQARVGEAILNRSRQGANPLSGERMMTGNDLARTVNDIDSVVAHSTGFNRNTAANTLTGGQRSLLGALGDDANRMIAAQGLGRATGSDTAQNLGTQALMANMFGGSRLSRMLGESQPLQRGLLSPLTKTLNILGVPERLQAVTADLLANPQQARTALATLNASDRAAVQRALAALGGGTGAMAAPAFASPPNQ